MICPKCKHNLASHESFCTESDGYHSCGCTEIPELAAERALADELAAALREAVLQDPDANVLWDALAHYEAARKESA